MNETGLGEARIGYVGYLGSPRHAVDIMARIDNLPYDGVQARAQASASHYARFYSTRVPIQLLARSG